MKLKETRFRKVSIWRCDLCGKEVEDKSLGPFGMGRSYEIMSCSLCKKDVCRSCRHLYEYHIYCDICWELGNVYREEMKKEAKRYYDKLAELEEGWYNRVRKEVERFGRKGRQEKAPEKDEQTYAQKVEKKK